MKIMNVRNARHVNEDGSIDKAEHDFVIHYRSSVFWWINVFWVLVVHLVTFGRVECSLTDVKRRDRREMMNLIDRTVLHLKIRESLQRTIELAQEGSDRFNDDEVQAERYQKLESRLKVITRSPPVHLFDDPCEVADEGECSPEGPGGRCRNTFRRSLKLTIEDE